MPGPEPEKQPEESPDLAAQAPKERAGARAGADASRKAQRPDWKSRVRKGVRGASYDEGQKALSPRTTKLSPRNAPPHGKTPEQPGFIERAAKGAMDLMLLPGRLIDKGADALRAWRFRSSREDLASFRKGGVKGPRNLRAPTGVGGFQASYDPAGGVESIRIGGGVTFKDGMKLERGRAVPLHDNAKHSARIINGSPPADRAAAVAKWQWTPAQKADWLKRLESVVEGFWSRRFQFHSTKDYWEDLGATAVVDIDMKDGPKGPDDHLSLQTIKVPDDVALGVGVVQSGGRGPKDNKMTLGSSDVAGRTDNFLQSSLEFEPGQAMLMPAYEKKLKMLAIRFKAGTKDPPMLCFEVEGEGATPAIQAELTELRISMIRETLRQNGMDVGRMMFMEGGKGTSASLTVGDGKAQAVAIHEFGHALGLMDEYAVDKGGELSGVKEKAGDKSRHDSLARKVGLPGSVHENNDGLMSLGSAMRPSYGSTFLWALREISGSDRWAEGAPRKVEPPKPTGAGKNGGAKAGGGGAG